MKILRAILFPPVCLGAFTGACFGLKWMVDNYPSIVGIVMVLIVWAACAFCIYDEMGGTSDADGNRWK
jgi:hypothetical protein